MANLHNPIRFVTYNMHGFNQGSTLLKELCTCADVIFTQEHWLFPFNLQLMHNISDDFVCYSSSAMGELVDKGAVLGRPYGGVAVLVRAELAAKCRLICKAERFIILKFGDTLLVNVYMPCKSVRDYVDVYCDVLASISETVASCQYDFIVLGVTSTLTLTWVGRFIVILSTLWIL